MKKIEYLKYLAKAVKTLNQQLPLVQQLILFADDQSAVNLQAMKDLTIEEMTWVSSNPDLGDYSQRFQEYLARNEEAQNGRLIPVKAAATLF